MATLERDTPDVEQRMRNVATRLQAYRQRPCLLFVSRSLVHPDVLTVRSLLGASRGEYLDLIVASPGGDSEAAYLVARELRRRFTHLTAYVPFQAKSAATLLCLAADELVLGSLGELGPLDQQYNEKQKADSPLSTSRLLPFKALAQLREGATGMYDDLVGRISSKSGMRLSDACSKAAELTSQLFAPVYAQVDPARLAESARGLEIGAEYAERVLKRYRPTVWAEHGAQLLERLVHRYPTHGFGIDREEIGELGLPSRAPDPVEAELLDQLALALIEYGTDSDLITLVEHAATPTAATRQELEGIVSKRGPSPPRKRGHRSTGIGKGRAK